MKDKPKHGLFQFRLATALLLMIELALFLGLNLWKRWVLVLSQGGDGYGWPDPFYFESGMKYQYWHFDFFALLFDVFVCVATSLVFMKGVESLLRRHETGKQ